VWEVSGAGSSPWATSHITESIETTNRRYR
jgi:hypothetical protein